MANGIEDLREKNKGRRVGGEKRYSVWSNTLGRDDAEMLLEKAYRREDRKRKSTYRED